MLFVGMRTSKPFFETLEGSNLLESFVLDAQLFDGSEHRLAGFHTINEEVLGELSGEQLEMLNKRGYLGGNLHGHCFDDQFANAAGEEKPNAEGRGRACQGLSKTSGKCRWRGPDSYLRLFWALMNHWCFGAWSGTGRWFVRAANHPLQWKPICANFITANRLMPFMGKPGYQGRLFYNEDMTGFNFETVRAKLDKVLDDIRGQSHAEQPAGIYVGSTSVDTVLPGFRSENNIHLDGFDPLVFIWMGNRSRIAAHYDVPDNIACCAVGRRRFILFPPSEVANLYPGQSTSRPPARPSAWWIFSIPILKNLPNSGMLYKTRRSLKWNPVMPFSYPACGGTMSRHWFQCVDQLLVAAITCIHGFAPQCAEPRFTHHA